MNYDTEPDDVGTLVRASYEAPVAQAPGEFVEQLRTRLQREIHLASRIAEGSLFSRARRHRWALATAAALVLVIGVSLAAYLSQTDENPQRLVVGPLAAAPTEPTSTSRDPIPAMDDLDLAAHGPAEPSTPADGVAEEPVATLDAPLVGRHLNSLMMYAAPARYADTLSAYDILAGYSSATNPADLPTLKVDGMTPESLRLELIRRIPQMSRQHGYPVVTDGPLTQVLADRLSPLPHGRIWKARQDQVLDGRLDGAIESMLFRFDVANNELRVFPVSEGGEVDEKSSRIYHGDVVAGTTPFIVWRRDDVGGYAAVNTLRRTAPGRWRGTWLDNSGHAGDLELELQDRNAQTALQEKTPSVERQSGPGENAMTVDIEAFVDGRDYLIIRGNTLQWRHESKAAVGRLEGADEPTIISTRKAGSRNLDRVRWFPEWRDWRGKPIPPREAPSMSSAFAGLTPSLPAGPRQVELTPLACRNPVRIEQQPSSENNHTLIVEFNDTDPLAAWYKIRLTITEIEKQAGAQ